jgi:hypothetical protein
MNVGAESVGRNEVTASAAAGHSDRPRRTSLPDEISPELWRKIAEWSATNGKFELAERGLLFLIADGTYTAREDIRQGRELMKQAVLMGFEVSSD